MITSCFVLSELIFELQRVRATHSTIGLMALGYLNLVFIQVGFGIKDITVIPAPLGPRSGDWFGELIPGNDAVSCLQISFQHIQISVVRTSPPVYPVTQS